MAKFILYILVIPLVVFGMDSVRVNDLFKRGRSNYYQARVMYMFLVMIVSYLVVNFIYDFLGVFR